ncbi:MAG: YedE-related selenium metabolism membrane protein, partial [Oscillospiraceae bacterium]|nr:YedE-related selenium metabolism membrane protein [Oscillospiraceae bacterium]
FLGMLVVGFSSVLLGGCPLRQLIMAGEGNADSAVTVIGYIVGAAFAHNFGLAGAAASAESIGGPSAYGKGAVVIGIIVLLVIAFANSKKAKE